MSLRFRYTLTPFNRPVTPLGGRFSRPRPILPVTILGPSGSSLIYPLLDTGADDNVFHKDVATAVGIDLTGAPRGKGAGVGSRKLVVQYAQATLRIATAQEQREWRAWIGFTGAHLPCPVLGFAGCLQYFDAHFRGGLEEVELTVNALYPGT